MIAKKVANPKKSASKAERAGGLADYITAPERENGLEKCIYSEAINFMTTTFAGQKAEMIALSQEAVKSKDPIDHWVLSWRNDEHPTPVQAKQAVEMFIDHCGLKDHQYIWGVHDDTKNMHVHIQVNRVHPDTLRVTKINKGFDREASQQAIAIIEHVQGWKQEAGARYEIENGQPVKREQVMGRPLEPSNRAKAMEVQTGEKSAQRIGIEVAAPILAGASSWKELHQQMAAAGMQYERKGSGAIIHLGDVPVKASDVSRAASLSAMQKRLGPYQPPYEINKNDYFDTSRNFINANAKKPHAFEIGKDSGHGLRSLSKCTLAYSQKSKQADRSSVLQLDARPDRRTTGGLRRNTGRDGNAGLVTPQPIRPGQAGWKEYTIIRDAQKTAKVIDTTELQKRHGAERAALSVKLKSERDNILSGDWKGKGDYRNAMQSILATQQAAIKLELSDRQKAERKELQARYKPLPIYRQWKEQPLIVSEVVRSLIDQHIERDRQPLALAQMLKALSHTMDSRQHVTYRFAGKDVFRDEGRTIQVLDLKSDRGIAAALATAQQKFGNVLTLTGSPEFQKNAVAVSVANGLTCKFADPALDALRHRLQAEKYQVERTAAARVGAVPPAPAKAINTEERERRAQAQEALEAFRRNVSAAIQNKVEADGLTPEQRAIVMARVRENTSAAAKASAAQSESKAAPTCLNGEDVALFLDTEKAIFAGDMKALASQLRQIDQMESKLQDAATPNGLGTKSFDERDASRQLSNRDFDQRREAINAEAKARGEKQIPFAVGGTLISVTYDYHQERAVHALSRHLRTQRPVGFFKKAEGQKWDAQKAELETTRAAWDRAVALRDRAEQAAAAADRTTFLSRLDVIRKKYATKADASIAKYKPAKERLKEFTAKRERIERAARSLSPEKQAELQVQLEQGRNHGLRHGR